ncbi:MAG: hypothetical protein GVY18_05505 [Bacteroidetes bacterium]|jgi:hypothetical protein|nr:hypothetical protein [Bacteroidota bacterium]
MTPEEYQRLKEAEKEHLRKLKKLKDTARSLARRNKVARTLGDMVSTSRDALDAQEQMVSDLAQETARQEARLELALEAQADRDTDAAVDEDQALAEADEELAAVRAKQLLHQIKQQMGVVADAPDASEDTSERSATASEPSKTLGPRRTAAPPSESTPEEEASDDDPLPDKTIGRMKP